MASVWTDERTRRVVKAARSHIASSPYVIIALRQAPLESTYRGMDTSALGPKFVIISNFSKSIRAR